MNIIWLSEWCHVIYAIIYRLISLLVIGFAEELKAHSVWHLYALTLLGYLVGFRNHFDRINQCAISLTIIDFTSNIYAIAIKLYNL